MDRQDATTQPTVYVVDDDHSIRRSLSSLFRSVGLSVLTFSTPDEFIENEKADSPSCLVLDIRLPGVSGLDFQQELARMELDIPIVFVTGHGDIPMSVQAMKSGAVEFLTKPFRDQELLDAVNSAISKDRQTRQSNRELAEIRSKYESLTPRETQVLAAVADGLLNKQIAYELGISEVTVKVHRRNVMQKMEANSLPDLVRMSDLLLPRPQSDSP